MDYKSTVEKEAARHFFKMKIWDADTLVQMIQDNYENLPEDIQAELPLKRIWVIGTGRRRVSTICFVSWDLNQTNPSITLCLQ